MSLWSRLRQFSQNATFANVVGVLLGALLGAIGSLVFTEVQYHDAVTYNNISSYIEKLMVDPKLVDKEVLSLDNPFEQIEMVANIMNNQQSNYDAISKAIQESLITLGVDDNLLDSYTQDELLDMLQSTTKSVSDIAEDNENLKAELDEIKEQKIAKLSNPGLKILGENIDTTLTNYMASIDGHTYYLEGFLNTFLTEEISFDDGIIQYGKEVPEKTNVISAGLIYDNSEIDIYKGDSHFTMGLQDYNNGFVNSNRWGGTLSIACNGDYSQLSFTLGHVDNTGPSARKVSIYYLDSNGDYIETFSKEMNKDMPVEEFNIPIHNTKTVKITTETNGSGTKYGFANVYLIR